MTNATATKPATDQNPTVKADVPETDATLEAELDKVTAQLKAAAKPVELTPLQKISAQIATLLKKLQAEQGLTRPFVIKNIGPDANGRAWNDSMVWRAFNDKIHDVEVDSMTAFLKRVATGELEINTGRARKVTVEDVRKEQSAMRDRVAEAIEVLGNEAKTVAQFRKLIDAALEVLADVVPAVNEPAATPEAKTEPAAATPEAKDEVKTEA